MKILAVIGTYALPACLASLTGNSAFADINDSLQQSTTAQIFNVDFYPLDNQIPVITHRRDSNDLFSIQLVVDVGLLDFPCEDRQLPHVVEHVLFEGTKTFDGKALRKRIFDKGGHWEGFTTKEYTHYTMHIHKTFADIAIDNLFRMVSEPTLSQANTQNSIRAVNTEIGTASGGLQNWMSETLTLDEQGKNRLYPGTNLACTKRHPPNHITQQQVKQVFDNHYVPANFTLLVIGQFDPQRLRAELNRTFGQLQQKSPPPRPPLAENPIDYTPIVETEKYGDPTTHFKMYIRADGKAQPTSHAWQLVTNYLTERLFAEIRTQRGIGYTPRVHYDAGPRLGHLAMDVKTSSEFIDQVEAISLQVYRQLKQQGISAEDLQRLKNRMLHKFEAKERDNKKLFQLYRHHREWIESHGSMKNLIEEIKALTAEDVSRVIARMPEQPLVAILRPNTLWEVIFKVIAIVAAAAVLAIPIHRRSKRRRLAQST